MDPLETPLKLPDLWQQSAIRALQAGRDVVVAAPTGAGKTYIFELLIEGGFAGRAVYTVPTRALANDKRLEWTRRGWEVGITTGDRSELPDARVVVATLEAQKDRLLRGDGPDLLVIDEYQMLADEQRGLNYELAIACAPPRTRLLLLSGSVGNPQQVVQWLRRLGRAAELVSHLQRPVPLEEIHIEALPDRIPDSVRGFWPRAVARVLNAGMAPLLAFAPRRKAAEDLAWDIARMLPEEDPLVLTPEQEKVAGDALKRLLRARVAYHHSGLEYAQRAALVEPLAKAGQLRVVVATMGLAAGINFSMRSVLVTDRQYRSGERVHEVRPDELLQMFGRAGRRGMDKVGYIAVAPGKPRLQEARPLQLRRGDEVDWPSLLRVMQAAIESSGDAAAAARSLAGRLFCTRRIDLGLDRFRAAEAARPSGERRVIVQEIVEIHNPDGAWERKRAPQPVPLGECLLWHRGEWRPALQVPDCLAALQAGTLCRLGPDEPPRFGRQVPVARFGARPEEGELVLSRWLLRGLREAGMGRHCGRKGWTLDRVERHLLPLLPRLTRGGAFREWRERNGQLYAILHYENAVALAHRDTAGRALLNPPERVVAHATDLALAQGPEPAGAPARSPADIWYSLGLIDRHAAPTRRGILFSFFNHGEGLAVAAALEDASYAVEDLIYDLANLRAGHRFGMQEAGSDRLAAACRAAYGMATYPGYLLRGLPPTYGEGAAELLFRRGRRAPAIRDELELRAGDIERALLEWRSLLRHIAAAPPLAWDRWTALQQAARAHIARFPKQSPLENLPPLTPKQRGRHRSFLRFEPEAGAPRGPAPTTAADPAAPAAAAEA